MSDLKISQLQSANALQSSDVFPVVNNLVTKKATLNTITEYIQANTYNPVLKMSIDYRSLPPSAPVPKVISSDDYQIVPWNKINYNSHSNLLVPQITVDQPNSQDEVYGNILLNQGGLYQIDTNIAFNTTYLSDEAFLEIVLASDIGAFEQIQSGTKEHVYYRDVINPLFVSAGSVETVFDSVKVVRGSCYLNVNQSTTIALFSKFYNENSPDNSLEYIADNINGCLTHIVVKRINNYLQDL